MCQLRVFYNNHYKGGDKENVTSKHNGFSGDVELVNANAHKGVSDPIIRKTLGKTK